MIVDSYKLHVTWHDGSKIKQANKSDIVTEKQNRGWKKSSNSSECGVDELFTNVFSNVRWQLYTVAEIKHIICSTGSKPGLYIVYATQL